jgi:hypothetical protein
MMARKGWVYVWLAGAAAVLAAGFLLADFWYGAAGALGIGAAWTVGEWRGWRWLGGLGFVLMVVLAALGLFVDVQIVWATAAVTLALVGWENGRFYRFLAQTDWVQDREAITKQHQRRLIIVVLLGVGLAAAAAFIRLEFGFVIALPLACLSIIGFSFAINFLRRHSD